MFKMILLASAGALVLTACSGSMPDPNASQEAVDPIASGQPGAAPSTSGGAAPVATQVSPDEFAAEAPAAALPQLDKPSPAGVEPIDKSQQGARNVLITWARALENHQFGQAWAQFIHPPSSQADFTRWWQRYRTIRVTLGPGVGDAAMGSIYYTAPATLTGMTTTGKPFRLQGDVVVRRVNDVDGATPAQLRWHIGSADLKDTGPR